jgi:hypothetical protein
MRIFFFQLEAIPLLDNPESEECIGAVINCWVKSKNEKSALKRAEHYVNNESWEIVSIEDQFIANRNMYEGDSEYKKSLECFDEAIRYGIAAIFYTWSEDDEDIIH